MKSTHYGKTWSALLVNLKRFRELTATVEKIEQILEQPSVVKKYAVYSMLACI